MDDEQKVVLMFVAIIIATIGGVIFGLASESGERLRVECRVEAMRTQRTTIEIMELCK